MTPENFAKLKKGDTVRHKLSANAMTVEYPKEGVMVGHGLVRRTLATNPAEWLLIGDDGHPIYDEDEAE